METNEAIALWKELGITSATMEFSCGGDSMNDYHFTFYNVNSENKEVESSELDSFFDDEVFRNVEFYVNSDGHYIGESGTVEIELDEDDEVTLDPNKKTQTQEPEQEGPGSNDGFGPDKTEDPSLNDEGMYNF